VAVGTATEAHDRAARALATPVAGWTHPSHSTWNRPHISAQARHEGYHTLGGRLLRDSGWLPHHDGIILLRLPLARLTAGTTDGAAVNLSGTEGDVAWGLRIGLTPTSSPGSP